MKALTGKAKDIELNKFNSTTTSMVTTFNFSGPHRQPSRLYNFLGVLGEAECRENHPLARRRRYLVRSSTW